MFILLQIMDRVRRPGPAEASGKPTLGLSFFQGVSDLRRLCCPRDRLTCVTNYRFMKASVLRKMVKIYIYANLTETIHPTLCLSLHDELFDVKNCHGVKTQINTKNYKICLNWINKTPPPCTLWICIFSKISILQSSRCIVNKC